MQTKQITYLELQNWLIENFEKIEFSSSTGISSKLPKFDHFAGDYLSIAEKIVDSTNSGDRINCISNLKRAAECQADCLLHLLNLREEKQLKGFPRKLEFIEKLGLMPSRSMIRFNRLRNHVEHDYKAPDSEDLSLYFDLVSGYLAAVENGIYSLLTSADFVWSIPNNISTRELSFSGVYKPEFKKIVFTIWDQNVEMIHEADVNSWSEFIEKFRIFMQFLRCGVTITPEAFLQKYFVK